MNKLALLCCIGLLFLACKKESPVQPHRNLPPKTLLWLFPDSTIAEGVSKQTIRWWGEDPDGIVYGFLFAVDTARTGTIGIPDPDTLKWEWTTRNDTLISFPLRQVQGTFVVFVRAVDNTIGIHLPEQSSVRLRRSDNSYYWDKNKSENFDDGDELLPNLPTAEDPRGANQSMPLKNSPPRISFANDPTSSTVKELQQPETTYTAATFAWVATDLDGDETITEFRLALNDTTDPARTVSIPASNSLITLLVPRARSDTATSEVDADIYSGNFLNRRFIRTIPGLRLNALNTFYVQAKDVAGEFSPRIHMPQSSGRWYVRKPQGRLLTVIDYISSDSTNAASFYRSTFAQVVLPGGSLANYDELNIGRGVTAQDKQNSSAGIGNPVYGALVARYLDPAFIYTLFLYDYVFWYTDQYPSLQIAQQSLFQYKNNTFDGRRGRVIFSTTFGTDPDPRGTLRDFTPVESVSPMNLTGSYPLPAMGDSRIPGGHRVEPDSSDLTSIFPPLAFSGSGIYSVFMRSVNRQPGARYIYRMQTDTRVPTRYTYVVAFDSLLSVANPSGSNLVAVGNNGAIVTSNDGGTSWSLGTRQVDATLRSVYFATATKGWAVGDAGTILVTNDAGNTWTNQSVITSQSLTGVRFTDAQKGLVCGTKGLMIMSTDGGNAWTSLSTGTTKNLRSVSYLNGTTAVAVGDSTAIIKSTDGGTSWNLRSSGLPGSTIRNFLSVQFPSPTVGYVVGSSGVVRKTTDGGETWNAVSSLPSGSSLGSLRSAFFTDAQRGWVVGNFNNLAGISNVGAVYVTSDGGLAWVQQFSDNVAQNGTTQALLAVAFSSSSNGVMTGSGGIIVSTQNGGTAWSFQPRGSLNVGVIDGDKRFVFVGLPLHVLNGQPGDDLVKGFLEHVFLREFNE